MSHIQPVDQGIIRCFKAHYRSRYIERTVDRYDSRISPAKIYDINQLEAMCFAIAAWCDVDTTTIQHCWTKAGILPSAAATPRLPTPSVPISSIIHADSNPLATSASSSQKEPHVGPWTTCANSAKKSNAPERKRSKARPRGDERRGPEAINDTVPDHTRSGTD